MNNQNKSDKPNNSDARQKKQLPLRLSASLYAALAAWAEDEFRSVNGQIEYLLSECVKQRRRMDMRDDADGDV